MSSIDATLTDAHITEVLRVYGVDAGPVLCQKIRVYASTLLQWNAKISLTAITKPDEILRVHFGESFFAATAAGITYGRAADIGTGAGFPGIPIRMLYPGVEVSLVEAVAKKAVFLCEVLRKIELSGVSIIRCRMEEISDDVRGFDFITARALGNYEALLRWSKVRLSQTGKVVLLLGEGESSHLSRKTEWNWDSPKAIPGTSGRFILVGSPK